MVSCFNRTVPDDWKEGKQEYPADTRKLDFSDPAKTELNFPAILQLRLNLIHVVGGLRAVAVYSRPKTCKRIYQLTNLRPKAPKHRHTRRSRD